MNKNIISSIYSPNIKGKTKREDIFFPLHKTFFFSYARISLKECLQRLGIGRKNRVLVPNFICSDVLSCFYELGIDIVFYNVNRHLICDHNKIKKVIDGEDVKALLFINYFGFSQPVETLKDLTEGKGIVLIEDNAHGFLSKDGGMLLGFRCDVGIFSLRKTIALPNGAVLVLNNEKLLSKYLDFESSKRGKPSHSYLGACDIKFFFKELVRPLIAFGGINLLKLSLGFYRHLKGVDENKKIEKSDSYLKVPGTSLSSYFKSLVSNVDFQSEIKRRRYLFIEIEKIVLLDRNCVPVYDNLPEGVCPYGYPFYYYGKNLAEFQALLWNNGLSLINWPGFDEESAKLLPSFYRKLFLVPFMW